jgi:LysR family transcriptional regulator (chromosome initiation inhibitor)
MPYRCVAAPAFAARWFPAGFTVEAVGRAPALVFDRKDALFDRFLARRFSQPVDQAADQAADQAIGQPGGPALDQPLRYPHHALASSDGFVRFTEAGLAYSMLPALQCDAALAAGRLVDLAPGTTLDVALTWHAWDIQTPLTRRLTDDIVAAARRWLLQDAP